MYLHFSKLNLIIFPMTVMKAFLPAVTAMAKIQILNTSVKNPRFYVQLPGKSLKSKSSLFLVTGCQKCRSV